MRFTNFALTQDGGTICNFTCKKHAVTAARQHAIDTGWPVTVVARTDGGDTKEATFNPNGTNENIWAIDKGRPLSPTVGQVYVNRGGGQYRCLAVEADDEPTPTRSTNRTFGVFQNIASGWTFTAKGIIQYIDGTIEWDHSTNGRFEEVTI